MRYRQHCPLCERHGISSYLNTFQINFEEAVLLCENDKCVYPIGLPDNKGTIKRGMEELMVTKDSKPCAPTLLQQSATHIWNAQNHQKTMFGTQTGTPLCGPLLQTNKSQATFSRNASNSNPYMQSIGVQNDSSHINKVIFENVSNGINETNLNPVLAGFRPASCQNNSMIPQQLSKVSSVLNHLENKNNVTSKKSPEFPAFEFGHLITNGKNNTTNKKTPEFPGFEFGQQKSDSKTSTPLFNDNLQNIKDKKKASVESLTKLCNSNTNSNGMHNGSVNDLGSDVNDELKALCNGSKNKILNPRDISSRKVLFPQWLNRDALCWLDVSLCLLVHNASIKKLLQDRSLDDTCALYKLIKVHDQVKSMLNNVQSSQTEKNIVKKPAKHKSKGLQSRTRNTRNHNLRNGDKEIRDDFNWIEGPVDIKKGQDMMEEVREEVWSQLHDKLRCEKDRPESPVFAIPLILRMNASFEKMFKMKYSFRFYCSNCEHTEENEYENTMPTFPSVVDDFTMVEPQHQRQCFRCGYRNGYRTLKYKKLPKCMLMHFVNGVPSTNWSELELTFHGSLYEVTGVVQYIHNPDHFIAWLRDPATNQWVECNDLGSMQCEFGETEPQFPSEQVHIVMWEKQTNNYTSARDRFITRRLSNTSVIKTNIDGAFHNTTLSYSDELSKNPTCKLCNMNPGKKCGKCRPTNISQKNKNKLLCSSNTSLCSSALESVKDRYSMVYAASQVDLAAVSTVNQPVRSASATSTPCSSLSALSDISVDSGILPDFTVSANEIAGLNRPVPSKLDVLGLSSLATTSVSNTTSEESHTGKKKHTTALLGFMKRYIGKSTSTSTPDDSIKLEKTVPSKQYNLLVSPNSAFCLPRKKPTETKTFLTMGDRKIQQGLSRKNKPQSIGTHGRACSDGVEKPSSSSLSKSNTTLSVNRFKMPPYKKQNSVPNLCKDVFKTLNTVKSESCLLNATSPALTNGSSCHSNSSQYLSTVKQYLIGRTTSGTDIKPQYEGFVLKSAPGLTRRLSLPETTSPADEGPESLTKKCTKPGTDTVSGDGSSTQKGRTRKRASSDAIKSVLNKITRKNTPRECSNKGQSQSMKNDTLKQDTNRTNSKQGYVINNNRNSINGSEHNNKKEKNGLASSDSLKENTINGSTSMNGAKFDLPVTPSKSEGKADSDCVLQDLYEALNIPFKSVPQTMTDIMMDVSDILGIADTCRLVPEQETTRTGNQTSLDCALTMTSRSQA